MLYVKHCLYYFIMFFKAELQHHVHAVITMYLYRSMQYLSSKYMSHFIACSVLLLL